MSLSEYHRKRRFDRTPEPTGAERASAGRCFVVQKHAARNLHYDFRLELDGVLKSWAVPKGPCLDPSVKRLAMQVEDHPVEYGSFEGVIPAGEYGGGTVMLWDRGVWEPIGDADEGYRLGKLKFTLHGEKLRGGWMLIRTHGQARPGREDRQWLLFKERDDEARPLSAGDILEEMPRSVSTGRTLPEIAADRDWVWGEAPKAARKRKASASGSEPATGRRVAAHGNIAAIASTMERASPPATALRKGKAMTKPTKAEKAPKVASPSVNGEYDTAQQHFAGVRLTNPAKVLYPEEGITKLELAQYYRSVADWMLPHVVNRPLVLVRCPDGRHQDSFYQKHAGAGWPPALRQVPIREKSKTERYVLVEDVAGLISLAQIGALEVHAWGSRIDNLERPDRLIFDLDPDPGVAWDFVVRTAREVRVFLQELGLESFVKTTGGKGLHVILPIDRRHDWDEAKAFCKQVADLIEKADPQHYTTNMAKAARHGKIFIDYLRNGRGATAVVPYSTRARAGAPIATPLSWEELSDRIHSDHFSLRTLPRRLASLKHDPWERLSTVRQSLSGPMRKAALFSR